MTIKAPAQVEREAVMTYLTSRWKRSKLDTFGQGLSVPDPGHGLDEICPVVYYSQPFDPSKAADLAALSVYAARELSGYGLYKVTVLDGIWIGQELVLSYAAGQWILSSPAGPVVVVPASTVEDGATVEFVLESGNFVGTVAATWLHGVGYLVLNLTEAGVDKVEVGSRASSEARVKLTVMMAVPHPGAPALADQYAGVVAMLFRRVKLRGDATAAVGTLERDLADSGVSWIYQSDRETMPERPNQYGEDGIWRWFGFELILRRLYRAPAAGLQTVVAA